MYSKKKLINIKNIDENSDEENIMYNKFSHNDFKMFPSLDFRKIK